MAVYGFVFSQRRFYTFVCPVSDCSIRLCVQSVVALNVCVSRQWRLHTFVFPVSGGSKRLCVGSVEVLYVCMSSHGGSICLCVQ